MRGSAVLCTETDPVTAGALQQQLEYLLSNSLLSLSPSLLSLFLCWGGRAAPWGLFLGDGSTALTVLELCAA